MTAIEYALIAAGLSIVIIGAVNAMGQTVKVMFFDRIAAVLQ